MFLSGVASDLTMRVNMLIQLKLLINDVHRLGGIYELSPSDDSELHPLSNV